MKKSPGNDSTSVGSYRDQVEMIASESNKEIVYIEYDPSNLPPPPSSSYTRFVCISDTHTRSFPVPVGDVLLHSGDLTRKGTVEEFQQTMDWICALPHKIKIIIAGNHDLSLDLEWLKMNPESYHRWGIRKHQSETTSTEKEHSAILDLLIGHKARSANVVYLQDEEYSFQVVKENHDGTKAQSRTWSVYGSPWSPEFGGWAFGYNLEDGPALISKFPKTDILLTHGPPYRIFDRTITRETPGCPSLAKALQKGQLRPRLHLFGHIHEAHGAHIHSWSPSNVLSSVQNSHSRNADDVDGEAVSPDGDSVKEESNASEQEGVLNNSDEVTVFVNAAAWPSGERRNTYQGKGKPAEFGGPGFRAVVVDLLD